MAKIRFTLPQYMLKHKHKSNGKVHGTKAQVRKTQLGSYPRSFELGRPNAAANAW